MFIAPFFRWGYRFVLKPIYFRMDPEVVHDRMTEVGAFLGRYAWMRRMISFFFEYQHSMLEQDVLGIHFKNPIGLSAGFDKNGRMTDILPSVGFGFEEVGSVTGESCAGNPKKRLWRLPKINGLVVNYGLPNEGAQRVANRLRSKSFRFPVGISLAKTNNIACADQEAGIQDYVKGLKEVVDVGDYYTINVSCPNAYGGQPFQSVDALDRLLAGLDAISTPKPIFVKLSADTAIDEVDGIVTVCERHRIHGFVISNLTKQYDRLGISDELKKQGIVAGGISGKPTEELANALISAFYGRCGKKYVLIGCGGIFSAEDVYRKIRMGASLVQLITGMIFEGPQLIGELNKGLVQLLKRDGYANVSEAIGVDVKSG